MIKRSSILYEKWRFTSLFTYKPKKIRFKAKLAKGYFEAWKCFSIKRRPKQLDLLIVGSDEMWEVNNITFHTIPEYFGVGINAEKKATYAVSSNSTKTKDLEKYRFAIEGMRNFDYVAVRDQSTYDACFPYVNVKPVFTVDPTLILDMDKYIQETNMNGYILCYTYTFEPYMIEAVKKLAAATKKSIVVVGQQFEWADKCIPANAFEFLGLIKNSDFVVTDTFHGTTLSIALKKDFVAFAHKTKVYRALELFDMLDRNVNEMDNLKKKYDEHIDYRKIYSNYIEPMRKQSLDYIDRILRS
jgi:hypothetical protein